MHGVQLLEPHLQDADRDALRRVMTHEADWLLRHYQRGPHVGVQADKWAHTGKNDPESNLWNGALLWRAAVMYADHVEAPAWRERALSFLANGVSLDTDATDDTIYDGRPLRERHIGASFFPNFALDHHGYFNVGYTTICVSNAAILHFDLKRAGLPAPQLLHLHQRDLWQVLRRVIFSDGRMALLGGNSRVGYAYCQEYVAPSLLYAADHLGEPYAADLLSKQLSLVEHEHHANGDGSAFGRRMATLQQTNPYYAVRLEGDRASMLSMIVAYADLADAPVPVEARTFAASVEGIWSEPDHGAVLHRCATRLASFSWRAFGGPAGLCVPPDQSDLAEWNQNLVGAVEFTHAPHPMWGSKQTSHRRVLPGKVETFDGGFATSGVVVEGEQLELAEGWSASVSARHVIAAVALPDGHTYVGFQFCQTPAMRTVVTTVKGLHLNIPNDVYNAFKRRIHTQAGAVDFTSPPAASETINLQSRRANIDGILGVVGVYGAPSLVLSRSVTRRGKLVPNLFVDEICFGHQSETTLVAPQTVLLDVGWLTASNLNAVQTEKMQLGAKQIALPHPLRAMTVRAMDDQTYVIVMNTGESPQDVAWSTLGTARLTDMQGRPVQIHVPLKLYSAEVRVFRVQ